ncbi:SHOCT domain-containing protein [Clostridium neuense]|uniref:SHOCT domain-containing protein n=1 Tax=Clostridium neuense TaxID=1728934 RepID=A0ABW8TK47_9CLOT
MFVAQNNSVEYLISKSILKELLKDKLITEIEFTKIDAENKKSFNK